ncbi:transposase [Betaproteobacteria bacterium]|nr:transposase [Betaproteobacteria bacterium]GHU29477.1 transposase [Betaproteobacteria bacterium]
MSATHDTSYKRLFSCPEVVSDLLRGYVPEQWLKGADYATLTQVNASYVSATNKQRHDDMVWRIEVGGHWLWIYLILEFQSAPDPWMAIRIMQYVSLLAEQLAKERPRNELPEGRLPPILPIVLYNGRPEWREPVNVADCFLEPPTGMDEFRPALKYLLLDERRLQQHPLLEVRNFADAVFRMEASQRLQDVIAIAAALKELLQTPGQELLRRAFEQWIKALLRRRAPPTMIEEINTVRDIFEEFAMLSEQQETWFDHAIEQGVLQGQLAAENKMLTRQLAHRFGPLPEWAEARLRGADSVQLEAWIDAVLDAQSLTDVLGPASLQA